MAVTRIIPNLVVSDTGQASALFARLFGLDEAMDLGWVANLGGDTGRLELQVLTQDASAPENPVISVGVATLDDLEDVHRRVLEDGLEVVHPLTDEGWGVRRFFFRDPDGNVVNVVAHSSPG